MIYIYTYTFFVSFFLRLLLALQALVGKDEDATAAMCGVLFFLQCIRVCVSPFPLESKTLPKLGGGCLSLWERRGFAFLFFKCFVLSNSSGTTMTDLLYIMKHTCTNRDGCDRNNNFKKRSINACGHVTRPIVSPPSLASYGVRVFYLFSLSVYSQCIHHIRLLAHCLFSCQSRHFDFSGSFILSSFHVVIRFIIFLNQRTRLNWTSSSVNLLHLPSHFASREKSFDFISWILCFDRSIDGHCLIENFVFCIFLFLICGSFSVVACIMRQQLSETHYPPGRRINRKKESLWWCQRDREPNEGRKSFSDPSIPGALSLSSIAFVLLVYPYPFVSFVPLYSRVRFLPPHDF